MPTLLLSLGANLGHRAATLATACDLLSLMLGSRPVVSDFYESEPMGFASDHRFLNCAARLECSAQPADVLAVCCHVERLLGRTQITLNGIAEEIPVLKHLFDTVGIDRDEAIEAAEITMKYSGYIERERELADKMQRLEAIKIRGRFRYDELTQLSTEARQKLKRIDPETLAQAGRIPGVSPSDISVLLVLLGR